MVGRLPNLSFVIATGAWAAVRQDAPIKLTMLKVPEPASEKLQGRLQMIHKMVVVGLK